MPKRIQRKRTKGWRMPAGAVYVGRPTKWGNPWAVHPDCPDFGRLGHRCQPRPLTAVTAYRLAVTWGTGWPGVRDPKIPIPKEIRRELAGRDLACWCPLDQPCHADVLLEVANRNEP